MLAAILCTREGGIPPVVVPEVPTYGDNNFWIKGHKKFPRPRYWWEKDPTRIPEVIPLVDLLEELEEEEQALEAYIVELEDDGIADKAIKILHAYAEILRDQLEMKRVEFDKPVESKRILSKKKRILLLLG